MLLTPLAEEAVNRVIAEYYKQTAEPVEVMDPSADIAMTRQPDGTYAYSVPKKTHEPELDPAMLGAVTKGSGALMDYMQVSNNVQTDPISGTGKMF